MRLIIFVIAILVVPVKCFAQDSTPQNLDIKSAWFIPSLTINKDSVCKPVLHDALERFKSTDDLGLLDNYRRSEGGDFASLTKLPAPFERNFEDSDPAVQVSQDDRYQYILTLPDKSLIYVRFQTNPGCGGACETQQVVVSQKSFPKGYYYSDYSPPNAKKDAFPAVTTPSSYSWHLYKAKNGQFYVAGVVDNHLQIYLIASPKSWKQSCDVALAPENLNALADKDKDLQIALASVNALYGATGQMAGGAGDCGTMRTADRWDSDVRAALDQTLYRPWALRDDDVNSSENSYGDYSSIIWQLNLWSLEGIYERRAFATYKKQFAQTEKDLAHFYTLKYGWSQATADAVAKDALEYSISIGFGFYMYDPYSSAEEMDLREAILDHHPIEEIKAIQVDKGVMTSVLDTAVEYPEALEYLLSQGADPNFGNAFSKTALMYAAQYDQYESAKILLAHSADPNAFTTWTNDTCSYTLSTARMTPLHYAVRYASSNLIYLLLDHGALTFNKTDGGEYGNKDKYPLDWLKRYTDTSAEERNTKLSDADVQKLTLSLRVPTQEELTGISTKLTQQAETDYSAGQVEKSYQELVAALNAQPDNQKALEDIPLVALRSERIGPALEAANDLVAKTNAPKIKASAFFNEGLACEKAGNFFGYNGQYYCDESLIVPFLQALKLNPTQARKHKIQTLFENHELPTTCVITQGQTSIQYHFTYPKDSWRTNKSNSYKQLIYAYHTSDQVIDTTTIKWTIKYNYGVIKEETFTPTLIENYDLGQFSVSELGATGQANFGPVTFGDQVCSPYQIRK